MSNSNLVKSAESFGSGFAMTASAGYLGAKTGVVLAQAVERVQPDLPVELMVITGAPLAAYFTHHALTGMAHTSDKAPKEQRAKILLGSFAAVLTTYYVTLFGDSGLLKYERTVPVEPAALMQTVNDVPFPVDFKPIDVPTGGTMP